MKIWFFNLKIKYTRNRKGEWREWENEKEKERKKPKDINYWLMAIRLQQQNVSIYRREIKLVYNDGVFVDHHHQQAIQYYWELSDYIRAVPEKEMRYWPKKKKNGCLKSFYIYIYIYKGNLQALFFLLFSLSIVFFLFCFCYFFFTKEKQRVYIRRKQKWKWGEFSGPTGSMFLKPSKNHKQNGCCIFCILAF